MDKNKTMKIVGITPFTVEENSNFISEVYLKLESAIGVIETEVYLKGQLPYKSYESREASEEELKKDFIGKYVEVDLRFVDYEIGGILQKTLEKKKNISQEGGIAYHTTIFGEIIKKEEYNPADYSNAQLCPDPNKYEKLLVDCGLRLRASTEKGKFKVGDYITGKGILQAYFKKVDGEKV